MVAAQQGAPRAVSRAAVLGEAIGAFALVFAGYGAVMVAAETGAFGAAGIAAAFGLVIGAMVYALGHVSGAHFNPAVTITFALTRHFPWRQVPAYVAARVVGALVAAGVLRLTLGNVASLGATTPSGSSAQSFAWEIVLTFFLMLVIMAVATDTQAVGEAAALAIGATVGLGALVGGPVSGASMNPARSIGPALVSGEVGDLWIYLIAPPVGALIAGVAYTALLRGSRNAPTRAASGPVFTISNPVGHFIHTHSTAISRHSGCMITADITTAHSPLLCELHAHTDWSDGELSLDELVDLYGEAGFDVLCVTDHVLRPDDPSLNGAVSSLSAVDELRHAAYLDAIAAAADRAIV